MYKVKFTPYRKNLAKIMLRQTKDGKGISSDGRYQFFVNEDIDKPDFWVVQGKGLRTSESCVVAPENTLLLTTEPKSILVYPQRYIRQFGMVFSCQEETKHKNLILGPAILPWFVGYKKTKEKGYVFSMNYDTLIDSDTPAKTKLISVITSNKAFTQGHQDRIEFVEKLKAHYGDMIEVFGRGYRDFEDKWDVLAPYKYHISLENSSQKYYWTEKISDCFLTETYPIYYGCKNLSEYFSKEAFAHIDIHNFKSAVEIIDRTIAKNMFEQKQADLKESKMKVLTEYNMFDYVARLCDSMNPNLPKKTITIHPCRSTDDWHNVYNYMIKKSLFKFKQKIKESFNGKSLLNQ